MIELKEITWQNSDTVMKLKVAESQKNFVADNTYSLAQAYCSLKEDKFPLTPLAIVSSDEVVGFLMFDYKGEERKEDGDEYLTDALYYDIWRFMIDKKHQGKGYGKDAMLKFIEYVKTQPQGPADAIYICYDFDNIGAKKLYESVDFTETGQVVDEEIIAFLKVGQIESTERNN